MNGKNHEVRELVNELMVYVKAVNPYARRESVSRIVCKHIEVQND